MGAHGPTREDAVQQMAHTLRINSINSQAASGIRIQSDNNLEANLDISIVNQISQYHGIPDSCTTEAICHRHLGSNVENIFP